MNDDTRFTEGAMVSAEVANRAINDALQFAPTPGAALSPDSAKRTSIDCDAFWLLIDACKRATPGADYKVKRNALVQFIDSRPAAHVSAPTASTSTKHAFTCICDACCTAPAITEPAPAMQSIGGDEEFKRLTYELRSASLDELGAAYAALIACIDARQPAAPVAVAPSPAGESLSAIPTWQAKVAEQGGYVGDFKEAGKCMQAEIDALRATHRQPEDGAAKAGSIGDDPTDYDIHQFRVFADRIDWREVEYDYNAQEQYARAIFTYITTERGATKEASVQGVPEVVAALSRAFMTMESTASNPSGRHIVLKFNRREDAYAVHSFLLAQAAPQGEGK